MCSFMDITDTKVMKKIGLENKLESIRKFRTNLSEHWIDAWALNHWKEVEDAIRQELTNLKLGEKNEEK